MWITFLICIYLLPASLGMDSPDTQQIWKEVLESIKVSVSPAMYSTWFVQTHLATLRKAGDRYFAEVGCKSSFVKETVESRYFGLVQDTLQKTLGQPVDIVFIVKDNPFTAQKNTQPPPLFAEKEVSTNSDFEEVLRNAGIRPFYSFENFAVSSSNQMAWAAADAVSKNPGTSYNPLFIWGGVGVGKTHLMNAVGYKILKENPHEKVLCVTGEQFTNDIVEGIRNKTTQKFRDKYRKLKALLIDDVQFIAGKDAVQEEFFHTFNSLVGAGSQVILTSDRPPSEISKLEERLRSRFEAGLIVDISPPDFELRCAIVQIKSKQKGLDIPMDLVQIIAGNILSPRQIEGFLVKLASEINFKGAELSQELIESLLGKGIDPNGGTKPNPNELLNAICKYYRISKREILSHKRTASIALPRQILMYFLRINLGLPLQEVGRFVGGRDHTTVMHAVEKITLLASTSVKIREDIQGIKKIL